MTSRSATGQLAQVRRTSLLEWRRGMLAKDKIEKIALCRPVVSVGQDIGFPPRNGG